VSIPQQAAQSAPPKPGLASFRRRIIFRGAFVFLIAATLTLALVLLKEEKQRSYQNYQHGFKKSHAEIVARLRHPAGQLALLNPQSRHGGVTPLRPLVLPYSALDFDDQNKAQQAVEMAGCSVQYPDGSSVCVAIGNNPYAGGFIYLVGAFASGELAARERGVLELDTVHRARVTLEMRGQRTQWIAPFESQSEPGASGVRGRLTGFLETGPALDIDARPVRDFRGWLWQSGQCADVTETHAECRKRSFFSMRLPVEVFREALFQKPRPPWPPLDLDKILVQIQILGPDSAEPLFDSNAAGARPPFSLDDITLALLPGETLRIHKIGAASHEIMTRKGAENSSETSSPLLNKIIRQLDVDDQKMPLEARDVITTPVGSFEVRLTADGSSVDRSLGVAATRLSWFVGAMLAAIGLAWLVVEVGLIRRITLLTRRAAAVSYNVQDAQVDKRIGDIDVSDLRGSDELGILAGGLADLLQRVKDDVKREHIRAAQERDMWHAVGHEIMAPLQSLMALHGKADDASHRYVQRMQQAVRVLYGSASPGEALEAATLKTGSINLDEFLRNVADNAHFAGIANVRYESAAAPVAARADEYSLEDVVTHVLRNADRHRTPGTAITIALTVIESTATITIHNLGSHIDPAFLERIFEYGVSDPASAAANEHRGQGLFVAKTYMAKMGGTIRAQNTDDGVSFVVTLQRVA
jgi:two-component system, OmpR family, sensor kinase